MRSLFFTFLMMAFATTAVAGQVIRGTLFDGRSGAPIGGADVVLLDPSGAALLAVTSDSTGRFDLPAPRAGTYALRVARLGLDTVTTEAFRVGPAETVEIRLMPGVEPVPLTPVSVVARRATGSHSAFRRRLDWGRRSGFGRFRTREELDEIASPRISTVLATMPGVAARTDALGRLRIGTSWSAVGDCDSALLINGVRVSVAPSFPLDEMFSPDEIEGIEVYRHANEIPPELGVRGVCSAVVLWTRTGPTSTGGSRKFRILAGTVVGAGLLTLFFLR
jgi:hypothetical protein